MSEAKRIAMLEEQLKNCLLALRQVAYGGNITDMNIYCKLCGGVLAGNPPKLFIDHKPECILASK